MGFVPSDLLSSAVFVLDVYELEILRGMSRIGIMSLQVLHHIRVLFAGIRKSTGMNQVRCHVLALLLAVLVFFLCCSSGTIIDYMSIQMNGHK